MADKEYIERGALRERMFNYYSIVNENSSKENYRGETLMAYEVADMIEDCIDNAPAADVVEVVHGTWTFNQDGSGTCDQCGMTQKGVWDYDNWQNYCGHCGARMDGERKDIP